VPIANAPIPSGAMVLDLVLDLVVRAVSRISTSRSWWEAEGSAGRSHRAATALTALAGR